MMRQIKKRNIITGLGAAAMLASLSLNGTAFAATTDSANAASDQAKTYQTQLEQHKNLQAYTNPLTVKALTTSKGVLPDATSGISNWSTVPAGTVANWDQTPEINKAGTSYGTVYVTFPDGSRSRLAVYVTVKDTAAQDSKTSKSDESNNSSASVSSSDASKQSSSSNKNIEKSTAKVNTNKTSDDSANKDVVVKDLGSTTVTEKNVSVENTSKDKDKNSKKTSNPVSVAAQLPETEGKAVNPLVVVGGLVVAAIGAVAIWGRKLKNKL